MSGQHRMPASIRRPPADYPRYSGPFIAVAAVNGVVLLFGAVFAVGTTVAPRVHAAARGAVTAETDTLPPPVVSGVTQGDDAEPPVIATSAPRTAARVPSRVVLTRSVSPKPSEGVSAGPTVAAPTTTTAAPTTTAPAATTTTAASTTTATETTTAEITTESTTTAATSDASELPTDVLPTPTLP